MRVFGAVFPQFWIGKTGKEIKKLGGDAQRVAFYLLTSPHASMLGVYYLPIGFISHEVGMKIEEASESLRSLQEIGFCSYDYENEYVWVHKMALYQIGLPLKPNDNRVKNVKQLFQKLPELSFLKGFYDKYKESMLLDLHHSFNKKLEPNLPPLEGSSKPPRSQEQEQEQEINNKSSLRSDLFVNENSVDEKNITSDEIALPDDFVPPPDPDPDSEKPKKPKKKMLECPHLEIIELYHKHLPTLRRVNIKNYFDNDARKQHLSRRWEKQPSLEWWDDFFLAVSMSDWLTGKNPEGWKATFGWLILPKNFIKVVEGNYVNPEVKNEKTQRDVQRPKTATQLHWEEYAKNTGHKREAS